MNFPVRDRKMGLINLYFLSYRINGEIEWLGHVVSEIGLLGEYYLVQLYGFDMFTTERKLVRTEYMTRWDYFVTEDEWKEAFNKIKNLHPGMMEFKPRFYGN